jgi:hypothetical protein
MFSSIRRPRRTGRTARRSGGCRQNGHLKSLKKRCQENPRLLEVPMIDYGREQLTRLFLYLRMLFLCAIEGGRPGGRAPGSSVNLPEFLPTGATARQFLENLQNRACLNLEASINPGSSALRRSVIICNFPSSWRSRQEICAGRQALNQSQIKLWTQAFKLQGKS